MLIILFIFCVSIIAETLKEQFFDVEKVVKTLQGMNVYPGYEEDRSKIILAYDRLKNVENINMVDMTTKSLKILIDDRVAEMSSELSFLGENEDVESFMDLLKRSILCSYIKHFIKYFGETDDIFTHCIELWKKE